MVLRIVLTALMLILPLTPPSAAETPPSIQRLGEGTLPILPCPDSPDRGCVELLFDGPQAPVACWTLSPFGTAGVGIDASQPSAPLAGSSTRRLVVRFQPLSAVPAATPATLQFGFPKAGAPLLCDQRVVVNRPAGALGLPTELDLGRVQVDFWGRVSGGTVLQPVFPAAGQPPIGPIRVSSGGGLTGADRLGGAIPVSVGLSGGISPAPEQGKIVVTASDFAEMRLASRHATAFPALGTLSDTITVTAPQLIQPLSLTVKADSRIGWLSILVVLIAGIAAGAAVRLVIVPRQARARTRLAAETTLVAAIGLRDRESDNALVATIDRHIKTARAAITTARTQEAIEAAASALMTTIEEEIGNGEAKRQALAARIAPLLAELQIVPPFSELPTAALDRWAGMLEQAQALIAARKIDQPETLLATDGAAAEAAAGNALQDFATNAHRAIGALDDWKRPEAQAAFAAIRAIGPDFLLPQGATPIDALSSLRAACHRLRHAAASSHSAIAPVLLGLAKGAQFGGMTDAVARTAAILDGLDRRPVRALLDLEKLATDYAGLAGSRRLASFEDVADIPDPTGIEAGLLVPPLRGAELPAEPALSLQTDPAIPSTGQDLTLRLVGLPEGRVAHIRTPYGSHRFEMGDSPEMVLRPTRPGPAVIQVETADALGNPLSRQRFTLDIEPAPDHAVPALQSEADRIARVALGAAAGLALLSGTAVFSAVPLTSWWGLLAPFLWGFFVNLNLPDMISALERRRDAAFKAANITG